MLGVLSVSLRKEGGRTYFWEESPRIRRTEVLPDVEPAGYLSFGDASAMESSDLGRVRGSRCGPAQAFAVLPGVGQSGASSLTQDFPFESGEYGQQPRHRSTCGRSQVQCLGQGNETHAEMLQFLEGCQ